MDDLEIRSFKNSIVDYINKHELPLELKRLVLSEILSEITAAADKNIRISIQEHLDKNSNPEKSPE